MSSAGPYGIEHALHQPVVTPGRIKGQWLVFCDACSRGADDYVQPCHFAGNLVEGWPPRALYEDEPPTSEKGSQS